MSSWQAVLIPLAILAVLGSIAFFIGYRGMFSNDPDLTIGDATPRQAAQEPGGRTPAVSADVVTARRNELREKVAASDRLVVRAAQERAILVQFIDLSAPGTAQTQEFLATLRRDFAEHITFVTRHLPSSGEARRGAVALEAADRQGEFIAYLEALTLGDDHTGSHQTGTMPTALFLAAQEDGRNERSMYQDVARRLGLNVGQFTRDMNDAATTAAITADQAEARRAGITRAPSLILLDDRDHETLTSLADFRRAVEDVVNN